MLDPLSSRDLPKDLLAKTDFINAVEFEVQKRDTKRASKFSLSGCFEPITMRIKNFFSGKTDKQLAEQIVSKLNAQDGPTLSANSLRWFKTSQLKEVGDQLVSSYGGKLPTDKNDLEKLKNILIEIKTTGNRAYIQRRRDACEEIFKQFQALEFPLTKEPLSRSKVSYDPTAVPTPSTAAASTTFFTRIPPTPRVEPAVAPDGRSNVQSPRSGVAPTAETQRSPDIASDDEVTLISGEELAQRIREEGSDKLEPAAPSPDEDTPKPIAVSEAPVGPTTVATAAAPTAATPAPTQAQIKGSQLKKTPQQLLEELKAKYPEIAAAKSTPGQKKPPQELLAELSQKYGLTQAATKERLDELEPTAVTPASKAPGEPITTSTAALPIAAQDMSSQAVDRNYFSIEEQRSFGLRFAQIDKALNVPPPTAKLQEVRQRLVNLNVDLLTEYAKVKNDESLTGKQNLHLKVQALYEHTESLVTLNKIASSLGTSARRHEKMEGFNRRETDLLNAVNADVARMQNKEVDFVQSNPRLIEQIQQLEQVK